MNKQVKFQTFSPTLGEVMGVIEQVTMLRFSYAPSQISSGSKITLESKEMTVQAAIEQLCARNKLRYFIKGNLIVLQWERTKNNVTLSGIVREETTGEVLPGAQLAIKGTSEGTVTNRYGFFSITEPTGLKRSIDITFIGYKKVTVEFDFLRDSVVTIILPDENIQLQDVVVTASRIDEDELRNSSGGHSFTGKQIRQIPSFGGVPDPLKALQFLPGVQTGSEGTTNFSVRGGSFDQNLFLIDEAPVYNPSHALSFFSVFNADAVKGMTLYKSAIPVRYGGRLSSVVDVQMLEGNRKKSTLTASIGTIGSQLMVEGPLKKNNDKISYMAAFRYNYTGVVWNGITRVGSYVFNDPTANTSNDNNAVSFYDLNVKLNYRKSDRDHFYLSAYSGSDHFFATRLTNGFSLDWGNKTATLRWNHIYNSQLFCNSTVVYSNYNYQYKLLNDARLFKWNGQLQEVSAKQDYDYYVNPAHILSFGWNLERRWISPGEISPQKSDAVIRHEALPLQHNLSAFAYLGHEWNFHPHVQLKYGVRYSNFNLLGAGLAYRFMADEDLPFDSTAYRKGQIIESYSRIDPRVSITYKKEKYAFALSYDRTSQFLHLLSNASIGLPTDMWMPSGNTIKPQFADIYAARFMSKHQSVGIEWTLSPYWKRMYNTIDFKDNANLFVNKYIESQVKQGVGKAYGVEVQVQKRVLKWEASVSYTWAKVHYTIPGINQNKKFPTRFDKRHNLAASGLIRWSSRWETGLNFVYTTGGALTVPAGNFLFGSAAGGNSAFNYYTERNGYRLPVYHRMDLSVKYHQSRNENRKWKGVWALDIYNVYGKKNPFMFFSLQQDSDFRNMSFNMVYLFGIVPTLSYQLTL